jgi:hypothetical protein
MDDPNNTTGSDEDILTYTVSDEEIEAAAGIEGVSAQCGIYSCVAGQLCWVHTG